jgi:Cu(I)/Ag(I) efflux system membrane fusion protein
MYATVSVTSPGRLALTAPRTAIIQTGERAVAFVDMGNGAMKPVDVTLGAAAGDYVEILSGLERGQRVVTSAQFLLDSESNLAEVMKGMAGMNGTAGNATARSEDRPALKGADMKGKDMKGATTPTTPR